MPRRYGILAVVALCVAIASSASAQDYRAEVDAHVINPCYMASARRTASKTGMSVGTVLRLMKTMNADVISRMYNVVVPVVSGMPYDSRMAIYRLGLANCLRGAAMGR